MLGSVVWFIWPRELNEPLPTTLAGRMKYLVENWVENDIQGIRHVTDPSNRSSVDKWWKLSKRTLGGIDNIEALTMAVLFENRKDGTASTVVSVKGSSDRNAGFVLFWKLQPDKTWLFDPQQSIRDSGHRDME